MPTENDREFWRRLEAVEEKLATLIALMVTKEPSVLREKKLKRRVFRLEANSASARRATIGHIAKRNGVPYKRWVECFGLRYEDVSPVEIEALRMRLGRERAKPSATSRLRRNKNRRSARVKPRGNRSAGGDGKN